ncbi:ABC transporter permease [Changpingibacter yushuensis]|uniref:ABC transporter permease n=1 Tax=Changpingibacter yushuensis TaxID=2758440 RepID=UPI0015F6BA8C|nr:FtsX-like permease family protein [Changpingibacter yushuensis]
MQSLLMNNLRTHARRYIATGVAIAISVAFVLAALAFGSALESSLSQGVEDTYEGSSVVIQPGDAGIDSTTVQSNLDAIRSVDGVADAVVQQTTYLQLANGGKRLSLSAGSANPSPLYQPTLTAGTLPSEAGTIALPASAAGALGVAVGDSVQVRGAMSDENTETTLTVSGVLDSAGLFSVSTAITNDADTLRDAYASAIFVVADDRVAQEDLAARIITALEGEGLDVQTSDAVIQDRLNQLSLNTATTTAMLLVFPAIAIVVALIVVSTTFNVTIEQRRRELALLRCVGATGKQVKNLLLKETMLVGLTASALGVVLGYILTGLGLWVADISDSFGSATSSISPVSAIVVLLFGTLLTVLAGRRPANGVTRIPPLAALQVDQSDVGGSNSKRFGFHTATAVLTIAGFGGTWYGISLVHATEADNTEVGFLIALLGMVLALIGAVMAVSIALPTLVKVLGAPLRGVVGRLAAQNAMRNKARTAATGTSVVIGITLVVTMLVGASSLSATLNGEVDAARPVDLSVSSQDGLLTQKEVTAIGNVDGVAATVAIAQASGSYEGTDGDTHAVAVMRDADLSEVAHSPVMQATEGTVLLSESEAANLGSTVDVCVASACKELKVAVDSRAYDGTVLVNPTDYEMLGGSDSDISSVVVKLAEEADPSTIITNINAIDDSLTAEGAVQERQMYEQAINVALMIVVALLGVAVIVALVGVSNTLSLSVVERTRENGLLRAMGLTRRKMLAMLAIESVLVSLAAALAGTALGVLFGWLGLQALPLNVTNTILTIPWLQLVGVIALAVCAAVLASVIPGRKAGRVSPVEALAHE